MSTCISSHGEYDSHETDPDTYVCKWCHEFDEAGALAEIARLRGGPVTGMEHAIKRAALHDEVEYRLRTAAAHYRSCGKHGTDPGDFLDREIEAMTERLAGLIAPAPLREEWGHGRVLYGGVVLHTSDDEYLPPIRRWVSDWEPSDRAEDDGRVDR